jgi:hypothetical protein
MHPQQLMRIPVLGLDQAVPLCVGENHERADGAMRATAWSPSFCAPALCGRSRRTCLGSRAFRAQTARGRHAASFRSRFPLSAFRFPPRFLLATQSQPR